MILHEDVTEAGVTEGNAAVDANDLAGTNDLGDIEIMSDQESIDPTEELLHPMFAHKCGQMGETGVRAMAHATSAHREQRDRELRDLNMMLLNDENENEDEGEPSSWLVGWVEQPHHVSFIRLVNRSVLDRDSTDHTDDGQGEASNDQPRSVIT